MACKSEGWGVGGGESDTAATKRKWPPFFRQPSRFPFSIPTNVSLCTCVCMHEARRRPPLPVPRRCSPNFNSRPINSGCPQSNRLLSSFGEKNRYNTIIPAERLNEGAAGYLCRWGSSRARRSAHLHQVGGRVERPSSRWGRCPLTLVQSLEVAPTVIMGGVSFLFGHHCKSIFYSISTLHFEPYCNIVIFTSTRS